LANSDSCLADETASDDGTNCLFQNLVVSLVGSSSPYGTMRVGLMDEKFIERCITEGRLQGTIRGEGDSKSVRITETTERLVEFVRTTPADELFSDSERWRKVEDGARRLRNASASQAFSARRLTGGSQP